MPRAPGHSSWIGLVIAASCLVEQAGELSAKSVLAICAHPRVPSSTGLQTFRLPALKASILCLTDKGHDFWR